MYFFGNLIEILSSPTHTTTDPPAIWITGAILSGILTFVSISKYKHYTPTLFKFVIYFVNFNIVFAYSDSVKKTMDDQSFYLFLSYAIFIVSSQMLESRKELVFMSFYEMLLFAGAVFLSYNYHPIILNPLHILMFAFVLAGNYAIGVARLRLTQISGNSSIQFKSISENARDTQVMLDADFRFVYLNPAVKSLTGYEATELLKKEFFELMVPADVAGVRTALDEIKLHPEERVSCEYRMNRNDGTHVWVESIFSAFETASGKKGDLIFAETRDIESRKKLQDEIQHQLKVEEMLIKHSTQFINVDRTEIQQGIDYTLGEFGAMLEADAALVYRMQGKLHDEFQSTNQWFKQEEIAIIQHFNLIVRINQQLIYFLRDWKGDKSSWGNYISGDRLHQIEALATDDLPDKKFYLIPMQSGNVVNGFIVFVFDQSVHHERSSFFGLIGSMVANAFTRLRTETRLHEAQLTNEYILKALPDWLYIVDSKGEFTGMNDYSTLESYIPDTNLIGKKFTDVLPTDIALNFEQALNEVADSDQITAFEYHDTSIYIGRYFKAILAPFKEGEYLIIIRDITDLKEAQLELVSKAEKLEQSNKELEEFAYVVSHDMKQPIRTIISYLSLLKRKYEDKLDDTANEFINFSIGGANKMSDLIRDILQYSRVEQQVELVSDVFLGDLVRKVLGNLNDTIQKNNAEVLVDKLPSVTGNETMLHELFQNLVENGIKYNRSEHKKVTITVKDSGDFWEFEIADNGIGFDEQYSQQIFKIFKRLHNDEEFQGTGIGLSICHKVVIKHGGKIWAQSVKGQGSKFYFTLPKNYSDQ